MNQIEDIPDNLVLEFELEAHRITANDDGSYFIKLSKEEKCCPTINDCINENRNDIKKLKKELLFEWMRIEKTCNDICNCRDNNQESWLSHILFLNNIKRVYLLSLNFDDLKEMSEAIEKVMNIDIVHINHDFIDEFNDIYIQIRLLHAQIMKEIYIDKLMCQYCKSKGIKVAVVSGPFGMNTDLPMLERVWKWDEFEDEWFRQRTEARQKQARYNPEYLPNSGGVYYEWMELRRNPYRFGDKSEDVYPTTGYQRIP